MSRGKPFSTKREYVLATLRGFIMENGQAPTLREFGDLLGVSPDAVREYLRHLEESGDVVRTKKNRRGIMVVGCEQYLRAPEPIKKTRTPYKPKMSRMTLQSRIDMVVMKARQSEGSLSGTSWPEAFSVGRGAKVG